MNTNTFNTPILLITFNRPTHTQKVFEEIKKQQPKYLYVFQDGAREGNKTDVEKCAAVRSTFNEPLDWDCEIKTNFQSKNLGCGKGPASGISWFFDQVEQGLIFEDDAVPAPDFFQYAEELLNKYKDNSDIRAIGSMKIDKEKYGDASYYFSMMNRNLCAWATWKRAWLDFDYFLQEKSIRDLWKAMKKYNSTRKEKSYWCDRLKEIHKDRLNESCWDIQFLFSIWLNHGMGICPNANLSTNIGFDESGTHTVNIEHIAADIETEPILPFIHPYEMKIDRKADFNYHKLYFQPSEYGLNYIKGIPIKINKWLKKMLGKQGSWINK
ncbi:MAG: hypothetical protein ABR968_11525 [Bacteroidales bacterium]|jgi:hypothetical protein